MLMLLDKNVSFAFFYFSDDYNRVVLEMEEGVPDSDYINASYVDVSFRFFYWPNSLDCTDLKISVEPAVTQYCVASVTYKFPFPIFRFTLL